MKKRSREYRKRLRDFVKWLMDSYPSSEIENGWKYERGGVDSYKTSQLVDFYRFYSL